MRRFTFLLIFCLLIVCCSCGTDSQSNTLQQDLLQDVSQIEDFACIIVDYSTTPETEILIRGQQAVELYNKLFVKFTDAERTDQYFVYDSVNPADYIYLSFQSGEELLLFSNADGFPLASESPVPDPSTEPVTMTTVFYGEFFIDGSNFTRISASPVHSYSETYYFPKGTYEMIRQFVAG